MLFIVDSPASGFWPAWSMLSTGRGSSYRLLECICKFTAHPPRFQNQHSLTKHRHFLFSLGGLLLALLLSWIPPADLKPWAALLFTLWVELAFCLTRIVAEVLCVVAKVAIRCFTWCKSWWWLDCGFCPRAPPSSDDGRDD
jgi:hypothetical protein